VKEEVRRIHREEFEIVEEEGGKAKRERSIG
jgi:hypothetical protein